MSAQVQIETPRQPEVSRLMEMSDAYMASLYPTESNHLVDITTLEKPEVSFYVARYDSKVVGCGALVKAANGTAEIKRMFVDPEARGLKIGKRLIQSLVERGNELGLAAIRLETGISQPEAISLYRKSGFIEIDPFPPYKLDPLSMFMELKL